MLIATRGIFKGKLTRVARVRMLGTDLVQLTYFPPGAPPFAISGSVGSIQEDIRNGTLLVVRDPRNQGVFEALDPQDGGRDARAP